VIVISPELLIFLFFMITDPKTTPQGRVGRIVFGLLVAIVSTLLMAPQTDEFGTKVALLSGLVLVCAARPLIDRLVPAPGSEDDRIGAFVGTLVPVGSGSRVAHGLGLAALGVVAVLVVGTGIVVAGTPARGTATPVSIEALSRPPTQVDPATLPAISVSDDVRSFDPTLDGAGMDAVVVTLAQNLGLERQALLTRDAGLLEAVDHGDRLDSMRQRLADASANGTTRVERYAFDSIDTRLIVPFGKQTGLSLGLDSRGTVTEEVYDANGALVSTEQHPFAQTFAVRRATGNRWLNVGEFPIGSDGP
jgi:hypothetical protein